MVTFALASAVTTRFEHTQYIISLRPGLSEIGSKGPVTDWKLGVRGQLQMGN